MRLHTGYRRASISIALAMAVVTVFTLRSFAAPEITKDIVVDPVLARDCTGTLTVKSGQISINGNVAQTGATVMSGSTITTTSSSKAVMDLGGLGRVEVGENTTVTLTYADGSLQMKTNGTKTEVEVRSGTLNVTAPSAATLAAGQQGEYAGGIEATSTGTIDVKVEGEGSQAGGAGQTGQPGQPKKVSGGLIGLLVLIGLGAGVAIGISVGSNEAVTASSPVL
jgi:hypothetical protein